MKNNVVFIGLLLFILQLQAQSTSQNYINVQTYKVPSATALASTAANMNEVISYIDGLGRPLQNVIKKGSPAQNDIIQPIVINNRGLVSIEYLPYTTNALNQGSFIAYNTALTQQASYYTATTINIATTAYPYQENVMEKSPEARLTEQSAPGENWRLTQNHTKKYSYPFNVANDIKLFTIDANGNLQNAIANYAAKQLTSVWITDEHQQITKEYKDGLGRIIVKESGVLNTVPVRTYYVYDDFNNLRFVLPPEMVKNITASTTASVFNNYLNDYGYQYKYDERQRMVYKKLPGVEPIYYVYDGMDRPILEQDGNLRATSTSTADKWKFIKYDVNGRVVITGTCTINKTTLYSSSSPHPNPSAYTIKSSYFPNVGSNNLTPFFTNFTNSYEHLDMTSMNYYTDYCFPPKNICQDLVINFYDNNIIADDMPDIIFTDNKGINYTAFNTQQASYRTRGLLASQIVYLLDGSGSAILKNMYYDKYLNPTLDISNFDNGDKITHNTLYNFEHLPTHYQTLSSKLLDNGNYDTHITTERTVYNTANLPIQTFLKTNNDVEKQITTQNYNELGQLIEKNLGIGATTNLQSLDYRYNIRGWLTRINNSNLSTDGDNDLFGMELFYDQALANISNTPQYNGNISAAQWCSALNNTTYKAYKYSYDVLNRLTAANYGNKLNTATNWDFTTKNYDEKTITYDFNGNILTLQRNGLATGTTTVPIDNLTYAYTGNKLIAVNDAVTTAWPTFTLEFKDNGSTIGTEYFYDNNGNLTKDNNKQINNISYNILNLPQQITFSNGNKIEFVYDAEGNKLRKTVKNSSNVATSVKQYLGSAEYSGTTTPNTLEAIYFSEGRLTKNGANPFRYEYTIKDHLGNARVSFCDLDNNGSINATTEILQTQDYYPFGLQHAPLSAITGVQNKYQYNGIEFADELNLNWFDAKYRDLDPTIGRWTTMDPEIEEFYDLSAYNSMGNNPIKNTDPEGDLWDVIWDVGNVIYDVGSAIYNHVKGDHEEAKSHWVDAGLDVGAALIPFVPAGVSKAAKAVDKANDVKKVVKTAEEAKDAAKVADKVKDATKVVDKTKDVAKTVDKAKDLRKVETKTNLEKAQNQYEGITKAQDKAKKAAPQGQKQTKINSTKKSQQREKNEFKLIKTLKDLF